MYPKEAVSVAALILKVGLIVPILLSPSKNSKRKFHISRSSYFTLSKLGWDIIQWNTENGIKQSINNFSNLKISSPTQHHIDIDFTLTGNLIVGDEKEILQHDDDSHSIDIIPCSGAYPSNNLNEILKDPGMRYLFRRHLEKDLCAENLDVFIEIKKFLKKMTLLKKLLDSKKTREGKHTKSKAFENNILATIDCALMKQANECLEVAYHIYSSYVMVNSPYQINIDHDLRESITKIMLHPQSPLSKSFPINFDSPFHSKPKAVNHLPTRLPTNSTILVSKPATAMGGGNTIILKSPKMSAREFTPAPLSLTPLNKDYVPLDSLSDNVLYTSEDEDPLSVTLTVLRKLYPLFENVGKEMYRLMKIDSLQKFMVSDVYKEATSLVEIQDKNYSSKN